MDLPTLPDDIIELILSYLPFSIRNDIYIQLGGHMLQRHHNYLRDFDFVRRDTFIYFTEKEYVVMIDCTKDKNIIDYIPIDDKYVGDYLYDRQTSPHQFYVNCISKRPSTREFISLYTKDLLCIREVVAITKQGRFIITK